MQNKCINTYYYGPNDPICHFSAGQQDLKFRLVLVGKLSAGYTDHCRPV